MIPQWQHGGDVHSYLQQIYTLLDPNLKETQHLYASLRHITGGAARHIVSDDLVTLLDSGRS